MDARTKEISRIANWMMKQVSPSLSVFADVFGDGAVQAIVKNGRQNRGSRFNSILDHSAKVEGGKMLNRQAMLPERLLTASEVAKLLNVSQSFAYKLMSNGSIPTVKIFRSRRVRPEDLHQFIDQNISK